MSLRTLILEDSPVHAELMVYYLRGAGFKPEWERVETEPAYLARLDRPERRRGEERIPASLKEKEVLLKEVHHRVKNNLQVISSLLNLQSKQLKDPRSLEIFEESRTRIRSMALIHEQLCRSKDLTRIDLGEYLGRLGTHTFRS